MVWLDADERMGAVFFDGRMACVQKAATHVVLAYRSTVRQSDTVRNVFVLLAFWRPQMLFCVTKRRRPNQHIGKKMKLLFFPLCLALFLFNPQVYAFPVPSEQARAAYLRWQRLLQQTTASPTPSAPSNESARVAAIITLQQASFVPAQWWLTVFRDPSYPIRQIADQKLRQDGIQALPALRDALRDPHPRVRLQAAQLLGSLGPQAREALPSFSLRKEREPGVRIAILQAIGAIAPQEAVETLAVGLYDTYPRARLAAIVSFGKIAPHTRALPFLAALLRACNAPQADIRFAAAQSIGVLRLSPARSLPPLLALLRDPQWRVQAQAIEAIGAFGSSAAAAIQPLLAVLRDNASPSRAHAALALAQIGRPARQAIPLLLKELSQDTSLSVVVEHLIQPMMRPFLIFRIGSLEKSLLLMFSFTRAVATYQRAALPRLRATLQRSTPPPLWLLFATGRLGPHASALLPRLLRLSPKAPLAHRYLALLVLSRIAPKDSRVQRTLQQSLRAKELPLRMSAAVALQSLGYTEKIQPILQEDTTIRNATERTLRMMRDLHTTPYLWRDL